MNDNSAQIVSYYYPEYKYISFWQTLYHKAVEYHNKSLEVHQTGLRVEILVELRHQQGGDPLDEQLPAAEGHNSAEHWTLLRPDLAVLIDEGYIEVVGRSSLLFTAEVPGVLLHRPGGQLAGEARLGVLLVAGNVGPGYTEES